MKIASLGLALVSLSATLAFAQALPLWERLDLSNRYNIAASGLDARLLVATDPLRGEPALRSIDGGRTWQPLSIGNRVPNMAVGHPVLGNVVYAAFAGGEPAGGAQLTPYEWYQSRDGGASWRRIDLDRLLGEIRPGAEPDLLYASSGSTDICFNTCAFEPRQALVSTDAGQTWRSVDAGLDGRNRKLYPAPSDANTVYALTQAGVYSSGDRGTTWRKALPLTLRTGLSSIRIVVDRVDANVVYFAAFDSPLQVTEDGGDTWRIVDLPPDTSAFSPYRLTADPAERGRMYYATEKGRVYERRGLAGAWRMLTLAGSDLDQADFPVGVEGSARTIVLGRIPLRVRIDPDDYALGSGLWWNPAMSGTGLSITQRESQQLFTVWFTYTETGDPTWYVMPGGRWTDRDTFETTLYTARGRPAGVGYDPALHSTTRVGTATLVFREGVRGTFRYRFDDGRTGEMAIEPQRFGDLAGLAGSPDYADLWWNPAQPGWGLGVAHQGARVFMTWFTYDANGAPTWAVVSDARVQVADNQLRAVGTLFRPRGPAPGQPFGPGAITLTELGALGLTWTRGAEHAARIDIQAFGRIEEPMALNRQPF